MPNDGGGGSSKSKGAMVVGEVDGK
jgi:hypothetical protein